MPHYKLMFRPDTFISEDRGACRWGEPTTSASRSGTLDRTAGALIAGPLAGSFRLCDCWQSAMTKFA